MPFPMTTSVGFVFMFLTSKVLFEVSLAMVMPAEKVFDFIKNYVFFEAGNFTLASKLCVVVVQV
jgi:hypothetical protein